MGNKLYALSIALCILFLMGIPLVFASDLTYIDDYKDGLNISNDFFEYNTLWEKYKPAKIEKDNKTTFFGALKSHTERCKDCSSEFKVYVEKDNPLIDEIKFYKEKDGNSTEISVDYTLLYREKEKKDWVNYNIGEFKGKGIYEVRIEGVKKLKDTIDWIIKVSGNWISNWAVWGANYEVVYDNFDDNSLNTTLWYNNSFESGDIFVNIMNETGGKYFMKLNAQPTAPGNGSQYFNAINFIAFNELPYIENMTINTRCIHQNPGGGGSVNNCSIYVFGKSFSYSALGTNNDMNITLIKNGSQFNSYYNGTFDSTFTPLNNNINFTNHILHTTGSQLDSEFYIDEISYFRTNNSVILNSPIDDTNLTEQNVTFNCSSSIFGGITLVNMSLWHNGTGTWALNQTNDVTGASNSTTFDINETGGKGVLWGCQACDSDGDCGFGAENRTFYTISGVSITKPSGSGTSKTVDYEINLESEVANDTCIYWVMQGASTEVANVTANCSNLTGNFVVSTLADYTFHFFTNNTRGMSQIINSSFSVSSSGGGGGGGSPILQITQDTPSICITFQEMWNKEKNFYTFMDYILCRSASSIVPI